MPGIGEGARSLLRSTSQTTSGQSGAAWLQVLATSLINDLVGPLGDTAEEPEPPVVLVLDDYHTIRNQAIHDSLAFFVEHLPFHVHLVILSRADPPLPLARLRVRDQLVELRAADLRFRPDEIEAFLNQVMRLKLPKDAVEGLAARTEGWAAGLHLAAISLQGRDASFRERFIQDFRGTQHHIFGYLVEEVLSRQPPEVQSFLLHTSVLGYLSAPLCDALIHPHPPTPDRTPDRADDGEQSVGLRSSQDMLTWLERQNLFIVRLDEERRWYRYHPLFAEAMRARLAEAEPDLLTELHRRAAEWYETNGQMADAVRHAMMIDDQERAARLIERGYMRLIIIGQLATLRAWLDALPIEFVRGRPRLALAYCWSIMYAGPYELQEQAIGWVEAALGDAPWDAHASEEEIAAWSGDAEDRALRGEMLALRAMMLSLRWESRRATECAQQAMYLLWPDRWAEFYQEPQVESMAPEDQWLRAVILQSLGNAYRLDGNVKSAETVYRETLRLTLGESPKAAAPFPMLALAAGFRLGQVLMIQGRLPDAEWVFRDVLDRVRRSGGEMLLFAGEALIRLGETLAEQNRLSEAEASIKEGVDFAHRADNPLGEVAGHLALAQVVWARGDLAGARAAFQQAEQLALRSQRAYVMPLVAARRAWLGMVTGDRAAAERWADELPKTRTAHTDFPRSIEEYEDLLLAGVRLAQGRVAEAQAILAEILRAAERAGRTAIVIEALTIQACVFGAKDEVDRACETLARALTLAEPAGYVRVFVDKGEVVRKLIAACRARHTRTFPAAIRLYVDTLLAAFPVPEAGSEPQPEAKAASPSAASTLVDPLTPRELEILELLATGASNQDIAERLFLSVGTVKGHINHILGKLDAHNRTEAAARGRELSLIAI
jgi:LuxR family maltose regulon positive regulatory protein